MRDQTFGINAPPTGNLFFSEVNVCVRVVKGLNSTFHFNPLVSEFTLSDRVGGGNSGNGLSALCEGRREPQGMRNLRDTLCMCRCKGIQF